MHQKIQMIKELRMNIDHSMELRAKVKHIKYKLVLFKEVPPISIISKN